MSKDFKLKSVKCSTLTMNEKIQELESEWIQSILLKLKVPKIMIDKMLNDPTYGSSAWRDYLFDKFNLTITKDLMRKVVYIEKLDVDNEKNIKIGEWKRPKITRLKGASKEEDCELELVYWQII